MTTSPSSPIARLGGLLATAAIALACLSAASYASVRYLLWPRLDAWRPQIAALLESRIGQRVSIGALRPDWQGWAPSLSIDDLRLMGADGDLHLSLTSAHAIFWSINVTVLEPIMSKYSEPFLHTLHVVSGGV